MTSINDLRKGKFDNITNISIWNNYNREGRFLTNVVGKKLNELAIELFGNFLQICDVNWIVKLEASNLANLCNFRII